MRAPDETIVEGITARFINWLMTDADPPEFPLCDFTRLATELRPGDVILVEGRSRVSNVIRRITQSPWTHAAIYLGRLHEIENPVLRQRVDQLSPYDADEQLIIESLLGKGTIISSLIDYQNDHIRICRPRGLSRHDAQQALGYAIGKLGIEYDVRQLIDLARLLLPWGIIPRQWRSSLFAARVGRPTREICSGLIAEAFRYIKYPILPAVNKHPVTGMEFVPRNTRLITPRDFDYSPYFDIIKYPMFDLSEQAAYRDLPWTKEEDKMHNDHKS